MSRFCERPGCSTPASIAYGIDPERLTVSLDVLDPSQVGDRRVGVLCRRHADAMVVPLGWMLDDHREPIPRLFKIGDAANPPDSTAEIVRRRRATGQPRRSEQLELVVPTLPVSSDEVTVGEQIAELLADDTIQLERAVFEIELDRITATERAAADAGEMATAVVVAESPTEPDAPAPTEPVVATLWSPVFDEQDDLGGLLTANSPLLSRAFGQGLNGDDEASQGKGSKRRSGQPKVTRGQAAGQAPRRTKKRS